jgi:sugar phosphate isomerase/epimerase
MTSDPSRRSVLLGAGAALSASTGSLAQSQSPSPSPASREDIPIGIASYSFREFGRHLAISMTRQLQTPYLCIKEYHLLYRSTPKEIADGRKEFEKGGIILTGGGTVYLLKDEDDDVRFYFEYAKAAGLPMMVIGPSAQALPRIEKFVKQYDIKVAIHNHGPEDPHFPAPHDVMKVIKGMDPRVGLCIDIGHTVRTGADLIESVKEAGPRLLDMHVKDLKDLRDKDSHCDVGDGAMPIVALFKQLKQMGYKGRVHLEYEINADNPLPGMQRSVAYMRGVQAGLRG